MYIYSMQYLSKRTYSIDRSMTNFHASSSGFVFGTVLLLLIVVINTANAACSSAMMFNSSSLEVAEEFARDSQGTTEIALDHLDRIPGRVLQSLGGDAFKIMTKNYKTIVKGVKPYSDTLNNAERKVDKLDNWQNLYTYLDRNYCNNVYCYSDNYEPYKCVCNQYYYPQARPSTPGCDRYAVYYCCQGSNGACTECCQGSNGPRNGIATPPPSWSSSSSLQFPIAYVVLVVIVIMLPSFFF